MLLSGLGLYLQGWVIGQAALPALCGFFDLTLCYYVIHCASYPELYDASFEEFMLTPDAVMN